MKELTSKKKKNILLFIVCVIFALAFLGHYFHLDHALSHGHVSLAPETVTHIGHFEIKNSYITFTMLVLVTIIFLLFITKNLSEKPSKTQIILEEIYLFFASKIEMTHIPPEKKRLLLSVVLSLFIIILLSNQFGVAPILGNFKILHGEGYAHLLRAPTSDFSLTLALGCLVIIGGNIIAFTLSPIGYLDHFFHFRGLIKAKTLKDISMSLLDTFLGIMHLISEVAKMFSVSARLFGNIVAGEIIVIVILSMVPYFAPIPFYILGLFAGLIQAMVFALLSMQFIAGSIESVGHSHKE